MKKFIILSLCLIAPLVLGAEGQTNDINLGGLFAKGGIMMYALLAVSIISIFLSLLSFISMRNSIVAPASTLSSIQAFMANNNYHELIAFTSSNTSAISRIVLKVLDFHKKHPEANKENLSEVAVMQANFEAEKTARKLLFIADLGSMSPMIGLLGTVLGMIKAFLEISVGNMQGVKQMELASGVSEALITTASGLIIGIIIMLIYAGLRSKAQKLANQLEMATLEFLSSYDINLIEKANTKNN